MSSPDHSLQQQQQQQEQLPPRPPGLRNSIKLLLGGTAFFALSAVITKRALARRARLASTLPSSSTLASSTGPGPASQALHNAAAHGAEAEAAAANVSGPMEALEALHLATLNVFSLTMVGVGAGMYMFDIETLEELRRKVRGGLGADGTGRSEEEVEEEWEEWVASRLARKDEREEKRRRVEGQGGEKVWTNERGRER